MLLFLHLTKAASFAALMLTLNSHGISAAAFQEPATFTSRGVSVSKETILHAVYDPSQNPAKTVQKTFVLKKKSINDKAKKESKKATMGTFFVKTNPEKSSAVTPLEKLSTAASNESAVSTTSTTTIATNTISSVSDTVGSFMSKITSPLEKLKASTPTIATSADAAAQKQEIKLKPGEEIITNDVTGFTTTIVNSEPRAVADPQSRSKFTFEQRIESVKTGVVGLLAGGIALTPFAALHDLLMPDESIANGLAQWEFDTDTGSIEAALFAIVYRYCVRDGEQENEMLQMGVVGAFALVRSLARIRVPVYCSAAPLDCGEPLGYFDWSMINQLVGSGLESVVMFGAAAFAVEYCYEKNYISRFR